MSTVRAWVTLCPLLTLLSGCNGICLIGHASFFNEVNVTLLDAETDEPITFAAVQVTLLRAGDPLNFSGPTTAEFRGGGSYSATIDEGFASAFCFEEPPSDFGSPPDQAVVTVVHGDRMGAVFLAIKPGNIVESEEWDREINLGTIEVALSGP